ncbi:unnamed protein product [Urochloa humidicola]
MAKRRLRPAPGLWTDEETEALLDAWAPLHPRRRQAQGDPWVPRRQRRPCALVKEDWRAVSVAVKSSRSTAAGPRPEWTDNQCKERIRTLCKMYRKDLARPPRCKWFHKLDAVLGAAVPVGEERDGAAGQDGSGGAAGDALGLGGAAGQDGRGGAAGDALGLGGAAGQDVLGSAAGLDAADLDGPGAGAGDTFGGAAMAGRAAAAAEILTRLRSAAPPACAEASGGECPEVGVAAAVGVTAAAADHGGPAKTTAARELFGGPIPKRPRTGCSAYAGAPSIKEELVRQARDAGLGAGGAVGGVGVAVDAITDASLAAWADGRSDNAALMAALGSHTASLARMFVQLERERIDLERKRIDLEMKKLEVAAEAARRRGACRGGGSRPPVVSSLRPCCDAAFAFWE